MATDPGPTFDAHPRGLLGEIEGVAPAGREKILYTNAEGLNERRPL